MLNLRSSQQVAAASSRCKESRYVPLLSYSSELYLHRRFRGARSCSHLHHLCLLRCSKQSYYYDDYDDCYDDYWAAQLGRLWLHSTAAATRDSNLLQWKTGDARNSPTDHGQAKREGRRLWARLARESTANTFPLPLYHVQCDSREEPLYHTLV